MTNKHVIELTTPQLKALIRLSELGRHYYHTIAFCDVPPRAMDRAIQKLVDADSPTG